MKPVNLRKIEMRLREELLRKDNDPLLTAYVAPNWAYMKQAISNCKGKSFKRPKLPFEIMARFLDRVEGPKTIAETELAKRDQLV